MYLLQKKYLYCVDELQYLLLSWSAKICKFQYFLGKVSYKTLLKGNRNVCFFVGSLTFCCSRAT